MTLLDQTYLSQNCDYSFGDQSGQQCGICQMKLANSTNVEFISKLFEIKEKRNYMTLFIDNIRLYNRHILNIKDSDRSYVDNLMKNNDLLKLCSEFDEMNFIIFTGFEDTPIDEFIFEKIPNNVLNIFASNAISFGEKVIPIPHGLQRKMYPNDNRHIILRKFLENNYHIESEKLLYINHNINSNLSERGNLSDVFRNKDWSTINSERLDYTSYLSDIKRHKFMICPGGNAKGYNKEGEIVHAECHRDWEVLYMRRVPIVKDSNYVREIFKDFPVLFVNNFEEVTENLLLENESLYRKASNLEISKLDIFSKLLAQYQKII
jgi:hypothetical protein